MNIFKKVSYLIKREGIKDFLKICIRISCMKIGDIFFWPWNRLKIKQMVKGKKVIVIAKTIEWNYAFQRTQQLAIQFSKMKDVFVLYIERPISHDFFFNMKKINKSLYCFSVKHYNELNSVLKEAESTVLYLTNLLNYDMNMKLNYDKLVYEYIDELSIFFDDMEYGKRLHNNAIKEADLVVATATRLYDETREITDKVILSENAGDYDFFATTAQVQSNEMIVNIAKKYDCVIGYYGMLADWFDYELVKQVSQEHPNWAWVLIGPRYSTFDLKSCNLDEYSNIYVLGAKPYKELPSYIKDIDILTIPFVLNDITASTSPVKLFEYMAAAKPIITSDMIECRRYKSVKIYHDKDEFVSLVNKIINLEGSEKERYFGLLAVDAKNNTWKQRTEQIMNELFKGELK